MANTAESKQFTNVSASKKFENFVRVIFSPHVAGDIFYTVIQAMDLTRLTRIAKTQQKHVAVLLKHSVKLCFSLSQVTERLCCMFQNKYATESLRKTISENLFYIKHHIYIEI